jgi:two-component system sensor histidine kinase BaeS
MLNTLRRRLILSHVLPLLVIMPLMGIALIYVLETQVLLPNLADALLGNATLMADVVSSQPDIWHDPDEAQAVLARTNSRMRTRAMLLDPSGYLLASSDPADAGRLGEHLDSLSLTRVLAGEISVGTTYSHQLHVEIADVMVPVFGPDHQVLGIVRLSYQLTSVRGWFLRLRYLIAGVLALGLLLGTFVGSVLAVELGRPLHQVTQAVYQLASGQRLTSLPEQEPEEIRLLSRAVNILAERLHSVEQSRRQLLANLVHELGRPLGAFQSAIQALQNGADEDAALRQELLAGMASQVNGLQRTIDDLAQLYDQVLGKLEVDRRPTVLGGWLSDVLSPWREAATAKGLRWEVVAASDLPTLRIDPDRLGQALGNLLSNAIKYTPAGGTVSINAGVADSRVWIRVSDTGPGITPEDQAHIFAPFYRGRQTLDPQQGMGLGLSIARDLVMRHGGRLEVESTLGQGSHFTVWLPVAPHKPPLAEKEPSKSGKERPAMSVLS